MIKVSLIVPIYNVDNNYLEQCINSLRNQTLKEIEIILVNDGSPNHDNKDLCDKYARIDDRIRVINKKNGGLSSARNAGFNIASGECFAFIDADDWLSENACEVMYNKIKEYKVDMVVSRSVREYKNRTEKFTYYYKCNTIYTNMKELQRDVLNFKANNASVTAKMYLTKIIKNAKLLHDEDLKQGAEGIEYNIRLYNYIKRVLFIENEFYHYRFNSSSITNCFSEDNQYLTLKCFKKIKEEINYNDIDMYNMFCFRMYYVIVTTTISGYFSPTNKSKYSVTKKMYNKYLKESLVIETLNNKKSFKMLDIQRKIIVLLIKMRLYFLIKCLAFLKFKSKQR